MPELSLIVIRVSNIESSKNFYQCFGMEFVEEQHGKGPLHYSSTLGNAVSEIYPVSEMNPVSKSTRIGFSVEEISSLEAQLSKLEIHPISKSEFGLVFVDPDGIKLETSHRAR